MAFKVLRAVFRTLHARNVDIQRSLATFLDFLIEHPTSEVWLLNHKREVAVIISKERYEELLELADVAEAEMKIPDEQRFLSKREANLRTIATLKAPEDFGVGEIKPSKSPQPLTGDKNVGRKCS